MLKPPLPICGKAWLSASFQLFLHGSFFLHLWVQTFINKKTGPGYCRLPSPRNSVFILFLNVQEYRLRFFKQFIWSTDELHILTPKVCIHAHIIKFKNIFHREVWHLFNSRKSSLDRKSMVAKSNAYEKQIVYSYENISTYNWVILLKISSQKLNLLSSKILKW